MFPRFNISSFLFLLFVTLTVIQNSNQRNVNLGNPVSYLPETKFNINEYSEYPDAVRKGSLTSNWDQSASAKQSNSESIITQFSTKPSSQPTQSLGTDISFDSEWASKLEWTSKLGQISAVSIDPKGNIAIFHRGSRVWDYGTFDKDNRFDPNKGFIKEDTIVLLDKSGNNLVQWGKNMFYVPHGLTIDNLGNYWITDVALHQVFKFSAQDVEAVFEQFKKEQFKSDSENNDEHDVKALYHNNIIKPSLVLGEAFVPGNDDKRFCKPTAVAVDINGDFFVSDGYCNSRIIKYNKNGECILQWGRHWKTDALYVQPGPNAFMVPHALTLADDLNYIYVADRENGRVSCFFARNGTFHKQYKYPIVGTKIYSVAYAQRKIYIVNGPDRHQFESPAVQGFVIDIDSGKIISQFGPPQGMKNPHDLAVNKDGSEIYVVELNSHKIYKFLQGANTYSRVENVTAPKVSYHEVHPITSVHDNDTTDETSSTSLILSVVISTLIIIGLCLASAAVVARCKKRGCLLTARKRMRWDAEKESFKLSNLLEGRKTKGFKFFNKRPNTRDFSKLNTEPESSEDECPQNSLTKVI